MFLEDPPWRGIRNYMSKRASKHLTETDGLAFIGKVACFIGKVALSLGFLVVGAYFIYGFGAGYFYAYALYLPTPLNGVGTVVLAVGLILLIRSVVWKTPVSRARGLALFGLVLFVIATAEFAWVLSGCLNGC